MKVIPETLRVR